MLRHPTYSTGPEEASAGPSRWGRLRRALRVAAFGVSVGVLTFAGVSAAAGASETTSAMPNHRHHHAPAVAGTVASVNGASTSGSCGTAGSAGTFTVSTYKGATGTVDVTATTTYSDSGTPSASFSDVCVGSDVAAVGTGTPSTGLTAADVYIMSAARRHHRQPVVAGTVASVNGVSTLGTCGTSGSTSDFTVTAYQSAAVTVDVTSSTTYSDPAVSSSASFADVCVGINVAAVGTGSPLSGLTASHVAVLPAVPTPSTAGFAYGAGKNGDPWTYAQGGPGTTPTSLAPGSSVVYGTVIGTTSDSIIVTPTNGNGGRGPGGDGTDTATSKMIYVANSTTYNDPSGTTSLSAIGDGDQVRAIGITSNGNFTASSVFVLPKGSTPSWAPASSGIDHPSGPPNPQVNQNPGAGHNPGTTGGSTPPSQPGQRQGGYSDTPTSDGNNGSDQPHGSQGPATGSDTPGGPGGYGNRGGH